MNNQAVNLSAAIGPKMVKIRQRFQGPVVTHIEETVASQLQGIGLCERVAPGMRIAIAVGSRGIANINLIVRAIVQHVKSCDAEAFIIPTMGSHGGATAEGQKSVLESLGVTEDYCGAPILSSMDVEQIGTTASGLSVYCDKHALGADGIILTGRIKVHTDFKSPIGLESGLMKMAAIGLGKHKQALLIHSYGVPGIRDFTYEAADIVLQRTNVLCGIGIVENAFDQTAIIEAIPKERIREREKELLQISRSLMPKLPVEELDLLIVDEIGKNYSGTGMDTNIIGRMRILGSEEPTTPRIKYILARSLSEETHGNALGIGLADLTTRRLLESIDFRITNENVVTSTFLHRAMIPIVMDTDREAVQAALRSTWNVSPDHIRLMRIPNTLYLEYLYVSEALLPEVSQLSNVDIVGEPEPLLFNADGTIIPPMAMAKHHVHSH